MISLPNPYFFFNMVSLFFFFVSTNLFDRTVHRRPHTPEKCIRYHFDDESRSIVEHVYVAKISVYSTPSSPKLMHLDAFAYPPFSLRPPHRFADSKVILLCDLPHRHFCGEINGKKSRKINFNYSGFRQKKIFWIFLQKLKRFYFVKEIFYILLETRKWKLKVQSHKWWFFEKITTF